MEDLNEKLIEEVRKREHAYNLQSKDYKDINLKENSWEAIANAFARSEILLVLLS